MPIDNTDTANPDVGTIVCVECFRRRPVAEVDPETQVCRHCRRR